MQPVQVLVCATSECGAFHRPSFGVDPDMLNVAAVKGPPVCVCGCLQTLAGGDGGRQHGDGQTGAPSGPGVPVLPGRLRCFEWTRHGGAEVPSEAA